MKEEIVVYRYYSGTNQSLVGIPRKRARSLNWNHGDEIHIKYKTYKNREGLFLFKNNGGNEATYNYDQSAITINPSVARTLSWDSGDKVHIIEITLQEKTGLFLYK